MGSDKIGLCEWGLMLKQLIAHLALHELIKLTITFFVHCEIFHKL